MRVSTADLKELDELMRAARMRVLHIISLVLVPLVLISLSIATRATRAKLSLRELPSIVVWCAGCGLIALLARLWYGGRVKATQQLRAAVEHGSPAIKIVEVTGFTLQHVIPFGFEVDIELGDSAHLAFGFWTRETAERLQRMLQRVAP